MKQNDKATVYRHLKQDFSDKPPGDSDTAVPNGMFILRSDLCNLPSTLLALTKKSTCKDF